jgi:predicted permease
MESFVNDLKFAFRMLVKSPLVTTVAVASLALGIGANTTIFTLINAVFLQGLAVKDADRIAMVYTTDEKQAGTSPFGNISPVSRPNFEDIRDRNEIFSEMTNVIFAGASFSSPDSEAEQIGGQMVSADYFDVLGVEFDVGRGFLPDEDDTPGTHPVVVLSYNFWTRRFGQDRSMIGKTVTMNRQALTVVGVAPEGFIGTFTLGNPDFWTPTMMHDTFLTGALRQWFEDRRALFTTVYGRLKPEVGVEEAKAALSVLGNNLSAEYPVDNEGRSFTMLTLDQAHIPPQLRENFIRAGGLLMTVVGLVLLIACANVANILLGRASARRKEVAVRLSLGAARGRLVRQLLTESVLLSILGGFFGLLVAYWGRSAIWSFRPPFLDDSPLDLGFDTTVLVFTLVLSVATGLLFGLVPALQFSRPQIVNDLKPQAEGSVGGRGIGFKSVLVVAQVALSLVALIGSGLFLRSLGKAMEIDPGFDNENVAMMSFNVGRLGYEPARGEPFFTGVLERAASVPGVESATLTTNVPLWNGLGMMRTVLVEGRAADADNNGILTPVCTVEPTYFETLNIPIVAGRALSEIDRQGAPNAVVINETTAKRFWPDENPVGRRFHFFGQDDITREVVGVAKTIKYQTVGEEAQAYIYMPRLQNYQPGMSLVIRAAGPLDTVLATVRNEVQQLDRALPITNVQTMNEIMQLGLWPARMAASLLGALGFLALLLASIGIYGVMSYTVSQRNREIGIRMALGAERSEVLRLFLKQGMLLVAVGAVIGLVVAGFAGRMIGSLLYDLSPVDFPTFALTTLVLAVVALVASFIPARRATAVDPVVVLRYE